MEPDDFSRRGSYFSEELFRLYYYERVIGNILLRRKTVFTVARIGAGPALKNFFKSWAGSTKKNKDCQVVLNQLPSNGTLAPLTI